MTHFLGDLSLALYVASFICYARILYVPTLRIGRLASALLAAGIFAQYWALYERSLALHTVPYDDLFGSMSLFAWLLGITYLGLELFHRERAVGAFVTLLLVCWIALLGLLTPHSLAAPSVPRGPLFAFHVTLNTWAYAAFALSFVLSVIYLVQDQVLTVAASRRPVLAIPGAGRAGSHGPQQRVCRFGGTRSRRLDGFHVGASSARHLFMGRSESDHHHGDCRRVRSLSVAVAQRQLARRTRRDAMRV